MARLASQAKAGYYPTPESVCELLKKKITIEEGARLLDPCCGEGTALAGMAIANTTTYGIELSHHRACEARKRLHQVLWGDALAEIRFSYQAFGLLFLNPPYDTLSTRDEKAQRFEARFLRQYTPAVQFGGFLVFVIPYSILANHDCAQAISRHFAQVQVLAFPEDEFQAFKQCIVFGERKRISDAQADLTKQRLIELGNLGPEAFLEEATALESEAPTSIHIPTAKKPLGAFRATRLDPTTGIPAVRKAGVMRGALEELVPSQRNSIRPLAMLENGHLALMLAGGFMNGAVEKDGKQLVIKGLVQKSSPIIGSKETTGGGAITTRDKYTPMVKVIDMQSATIHVVN